MPIGYWGKVTAAVAPFGASTTPGAGSHRSLKAEDVEGVNSTLLPLTDAVIWDVQSFNQVFSLQALEPGQEAWSSTKRAAAQQQRTGSATAD